MAAPKMVTPQPGGWPVPTSKPQATGSTPANPRRLNLLQAPTGCAPPHLHQPRSPEGDLGFLSPVRLLPLSLPFLAACSARPAARTENVRPLWDTGFCRQPAGQKG